MSSRKESTKRETSNWLEITRDRKAQKMFHILLCLLVYTECVTEIFPIEEISALLYTPRWLPHDIRRMFCKCFRGQ